jgi:hypothetical protein
MSTQRNVVKSLIASALMAIASGMADAGVGPGIDQFLRWISMGNGEVLLVTTIIIRGGKGARASISTTTNLCYLSINNRNNTITTITAAIAINSSVSSLDCLIRIPCVV